MKYLFRLICAFLLVFFMASGSIADSKKFHIVTAFNAEAFASGTAEYFPASGGIDLSAYSDTEGYFSVQIYLNDADGSMTLEWEVSADNTNFTEPLDVDGVRVPDIVTSFAFNGGVGTDGREYLPVPKPIGGKYVRIKATPSAHAITGLTVYLVIF